MHAADAQFHYDCYKKFKWITFDRKQGKITDDALEEVSKIMCDDRTRIWNMVQLYELYKSYGLQLSQRILTKNISSTLSNVLLLSGIGVANPCVLESRIMHLTT